MYAVTLGICLLPLVWSLFRGTQTTEHHGATPLSLMGLAAARSAAALLALWVLVLAWIRDRRHPAGLCSATVAIGMVSFGTLDALLASGALGVVPMPDLAVQAVAGLGALGKTLAAAIMLGAIGFFRKRGALPKGIRSRAVAYATMVAALSVCALVLMVDVAAGSRPDAYAPVGGIIEWLPLIPIAIAVTILARIRHVAGVGMTLLTASFLPLAAGALYAASGFHAAHPAGWWIEPALALCAYALAGGAVIEDLGIAPPDHAPAHELRDRETRLQSVFETAADAIIVVDSEGTIESANRAAGRMFGYRVDELIGANVGILTYDGNIEKHNAQMKRYLDTGQAKIIGLTRDVDARRKDGTVFPAELSINETRLGDRMLFTGFVRDVTERYQAEERLRASQRSEKQSRVWLQQTIDAALHTIIVATDDNGFITMINDGTTQMLGVSKEDAVGKLCPTTWLDEREMEILRRDVENATGTSVSAFEALVHGVEGETAVEHECTIRCGQSMTFSVALSITRVDHDEGTTGYLLIGTDISSRKASEVSLRNYARALENSVTALELANAKAETAAKVKSAFLTNMSHEIRTPLTAILGFSELLRNELDSGDERQREYFDVILANGNHLLDVINYILDHSMIESGRMEINRTTFNLRALVDGVYRMMGSRADTKGIGLTVHVEPDVPEFIHSDPNRLKQILINLVDNAVKFTDTGHVRIIVGHADANGESRITFDVCDDGIGIPADKIQHLFEPFTQADYSMSRRFGGTGLGLTITRDLVEMLGGEIRVESVVGEGSTFSVTIDGGRPTGLMSADRSATGTAESDKPQTERLDHLRVLIAEDGPDNRRLITAIVERAGGLVTSVSDGRTAVDAVLEEERAGRPFDVVLMDMQMPIMDGLAATRTLRQHGITRPIIALTAHAMQQDVEQCLEAGCDEHIGKPIDRSRFIGTILRSVRAHADKVTNAVQPRPVHPA